MEQQPTRTCTRCAATKPIGDFPLRRKGSDRRQAYCRDCKAGMQKSWYTRNKRRHLREVNRHKARYRAQNRAIVTAAKDRSCADCGKRYPTFAMDFDHVRGEKRGDISRLAAAPVSPAALQAEIEKCDVVCANCHRERTHRRRAKTRGAAP